MFTRRTIFESPEEGNGNGKFREGVKVGVISAGSALNVHGPEEFRAPLFLTIKCSERESVGRDTDRNRNLGVLVLGLATKRHSFFI